MKRPTFKLICLSDILCSVLGWGSGHYFSQHKTLCPPCRGVWDLALFVYWFIHQELKLVQHLQIYSVLKIKSFHSWPGNFKQILSELCQDCNNLMPCLHAMLTRYCCLQWWLGFLNNMSSVNGIWKGMAPEWSVCMSGWHWELVAVIQQGAPGIGWETRSMFQFSLHAASVTFQCLLMLI